MGKPFSDDDVRAALKYDQETGVLTWNKSGSRIRKGAPAGCFHGGYIRLELNGKSMYAHRIAWFLHYGEWADKDIDHINGNKSDNRISNLRLADHAKNCQNRRKARSDSRTGVIGVGKRGKRFAASICTNGKDKFLGYFDDIESAAKAYLTAKRELHAFCTI